MYGSRQDHRPARLARTLAVCGVVAMSATGLAACGEDNDNATVGAGSDAASAGLAAEAKRIVGTASTGMVAAPGLGYIDPKAIRDVSESERPAPSPRPSGGPKEVAIVKCLPLGGCENVGNKISSIMREFGWSVRVSAADGRPPRSAALMDAAIARKPDVIVTVSIGGRAIASQLERAREQGILTVTANGTPEGGEGYDGYVDGRENVSKELLAAGLVNENPDLKAVFLELQGRPELGGAAGVRMLEACKGCSVKSETWNPADFLNPVQAQQKLSALTAASPDLSAVVYPTDGVPLQPAVQALSRAQDVKLTSSDFTPPSLKLIRGGDVTYLTSAPQTWLALASVDAVLKGLAKQPIPKADEWGVGVSLVTEQNAPSGAIDFATIDRWDRERFDFAAPYEKAWNIDVDELG